MNTLQQAFINGFVKRAAEYGIASAEAINLAKYSAYKAQEDLEKIKADVELQTLFGGGLPGAAYNAYKDFNPPEELDKRMDIPFRTPRILGGNTLGALLGLGLGGGIGALIADHGAAPGAALGGIGGGLLGSYLGANSYNKALEREAIKAKLMKAQ